MLLKHLLVAIESYCYPHNISLKYSTRVERNSSKLNYIFARDSTVLNDQLVHFYFSHSAPVVHSTGRIGKKSGIPENGRFCGNVHKSVNMQPFLNGKKFFMQIMLSYRFRTLNFHFEENGRQTSFAHRGVEQFKATLVNIFQLTFTNDKVPSDKIPVYEIQ